MDKDTLIKHHFWILLVLAVILLPVAMGGVWMGVADATETERKKIEDRQTKLTAAKAKGKQYVEAIEKDKETLEKTKFKVWEEVYKAQAGLITWPRSLPQAELLDERLYFADPVRQEIRNAFKRADVYQPEFEALADLVKPTELSGGWQQVMRSVKWGDRLPSDEDVWLALEDLCVQRELLKCVHDVNMLLARFTRVDLAKSADVDKELKETFKPEEGESVARFLSPYWQLDLAIKKNLKSDKAGEFEVRYTLKNVSGRRLNVGAVDLMLTMVEPGAAGRPATLRIEGGYLGHEEQIPPAGDGQGPAVGRKTITSGAPKAVVYAVEQKLDARYVPVKRIDKISLGYHSHRTSDKPLVTCALSEEAKNKAAQSGEPPADPSAASAGGVPTPGGGAAPSADKSPSGIDRLRYITCNKQVRRMPIGLVLLVEQGHVQDVLRAFANSRLRFQTTQAHFTRVRGAASAGGPAAPPPVVMPRPMGVPGPGPMAAPQAAAPEEPSGNLVEVAIYGLASIYERYPPKPPAPPSETPAAPASPPAGTAPASPNPG